MWQPDIDSLKQLAELLSHSQSKDNKKQQEIFQYVSQLQKNPEFPCYLVYILATKDDNDINTLRQTAGLTLKGVLEQTAKQLPEPNLNYVKQKLIEAFDESVPYIRRAISIAITALFTTLGYKKWPEIITFLSQNLKIDSVEVVEASLDTLVKILEDIRVNSENMEYLGDNNDPISDLIPSLIQLCNPKLPSKIKALALSGLNLFAFAMPPKLVANMEYYFEVLFLSAVDENAEVRLTSCHGFLELLERRKDFIMAYLIKVIEQILKLTFDQDKEIAKVACRFWNEFLIEEVNESPERIQSLKLYLNDLVPHLIDLMRYTEEDLMNLADTESKTSSTQNVFKESTGEGGDDDEDGLRELDRDGQNLFDQGEYTLRKEASHVLDALSRHFEETIFQIAQPKIEKCLESNAWKIQQSRSVFLIVRESGILAIGSIAKGAFEAIEPHLQTIFPFLMKTISGNTHELVKMIALWTLSRFSKWISNQKSINRNDIVLPYLVEILKKMNDDSFMVFQAACGSVSKLCYQDPFLIEEFMPDVMNIIKQADAKYPRNQFKYLVDVMATISNSCQHEILKQDDYERCFLEIISKKWDEFSFDDFDSVVLVECTDTIMNSLEDHMSKYVEYFVPKLMFLIANYIKLRDTKDRHLFQRKEIATRCYSLLGTFIQQVGNLLDNLILREDYLTMFVECTKDQDLILRQYVLSSIGEFAKFCPNKLQGSVEIIAPVLMNHLQASVEDLGAETALIDSLSNNASWSLGELAVALPDDYRGVAYDFALQICKIFSENDKIHIGLAQNLSITIGRLGLINPSALGPLLPKYLKRFCLSLAKFRDDIEKRQAFRGLFLVIAENPNGIAEDFHFLCHALVNLDASEDPELGDLSIKLVQNFKNIAGQHWESYFQKFPPDLQSKMKQKFGV